MTRAPEILSRDANHVVALADNVLLQLWLGAVPLEGANAVVAAGKRLKSAGKPFTTLIVVGSNAAPPQAPSRSALVSFAQQSLPELTCAVLVVEPTGLKGAIMRSIMTGMSMVVQSVETVIVRSVDEGVAALRAHGAASEEGELERVIRDLRGAEPRPPPSRSSSGLRSV